MRKPGSGIFCHIISLPSPYGIGDLGAGASAFADFLHEAKQSYWQVLPLNPTNKRYFDSPFSSLSSCAGNTALISPQMLVAEKLLTQPEVEDHPPFQDDKVDYPGASMFKKRLFLRAHRRLQSSEARDQDYVRFCNGNTEWLEDHALFTALTDHLPHHHVRNSIVYTGTHDTNTTTGWFESAVSAEKAALSRYLGREVESGANWELIRLAMMSVAKTAVIQMQDVVGSGAGSRMNTPGKADGNWQWRIPPADLSAPASKLAEMAVCHGRAR